MKMFSLDHFGKRIAHPRLEGSLEPGSAPVSLSIEAMRRELAVFSADTLGAQAHVGQFGMNGAPLRLPRSERKRLRGLIESSPLPYMVIDPRPGLHLLDINDAYGLATLTGRNIAGGKLFDVFPDNPDLRGADGVSNLYESIRNASQTGREHMMAIQRYDVRDANGLFVERYWRPVNTPVFDDAGQLLYLLHYAGELSEDELRPPGGPAEYI